MAARQKKITINGVEYTLQDPGVRWIVRHSDNCTLPSGKISREKYIDGLFENVVIEPVVKLDDFNGRIDELNDLVVEVDGFLQCS